MANNGTNASNVPGVVLTAIHTKPMNRRLINGWCL